MGSVTTGRKHLRDRNREGLERWLANRLKHDRLPYVREIPDVHLSMEADGRVFVRVQWIDAWPTHVAKAVALHRAIAASPPPLSRQKPRF